MGSDYHDMTVDVRGLESGLAEGLSGFGDDISCFDFSDDNDRAQPTGEWTAMGGDMPHRLLRAITTPSTYYLVHK